MNLHTSFCVNNCNLLLRNIEITDYDKGYLNLLRQLTHIEPDKITFNHFNNFIDSFKDKFILILFCFLIFGILFFLK